MLDQIRDTIRNSTPAELAGDAIGALAIAVIMGGLCFLPLVAP